LYAWRDGQRVRLGCHTGSITALEPAGETLVLVAGRDHRVCLWDSASGQSVADQSWPFWARGARAAHDGARAVLLHHGLTLLELPKLVEVARSPRYSWRGVCRAATFAPEGDALIVGKANGEVWVCRQEAGQLRPEPAPWRRHPQEVRGIELLPRRPVVITGAADGQIQFTSWPNRGAIGAVHNAGQRLTSLHVSPDGAFMVTGDSDATMSLWDLRALDVPRLFAQPLVQAVPAQLAAVSALLTDAALPAHARPPLRFLEVLLRHRFRFDIEVDELTSIQHGEFDIEVEG
jgi:WD40 repeat protein